MANIGMGSNEDKTFEVVSVDILDEYDKALIEDGKNALVNSVDTIKSFAQSMITLVSGLFAVYFALLEFLGVTSDSLGQDAVLGNAVFLPPIFFIITIVIFVFAVLPLPGMSSLTILEELQRNRRLTLRIKYTAVILGMAFLVSALCITVVVFIGH